MVGAKLSLSFKFIERILSYEYILKCRKKYLFLYPLEAISYYYLTREVNLYKEKQALAASLIHTVHKIWTYTAERNGKLIQCD